MSVNLDTKKSIGKIFSPFYYLLISLTALSLSACGGGGDAAPPSPGIAISKTVLSTSEDNTEDSFSVMLKTRPAYDVSMTFTSRDTTEGLIGSGTDVDWGFNYFGTTVDLDFTPANWNVPQIIRVEGQSDTILDGNQTYSVAMTWLWSLDLSYIGLAQPTVSVTNIDTSAPSITVSKTNLTTAENGTSDSFAVVLNLEPSSAVSIPLTITDSSEGVFPDGSTTRTLTFDASNWSTWQGISINDVDDANADGNQTYDVTLGPASSADAGYDGLSLSPVSVTNIDNDTAAFTVSATSVQTKEWGQTASFTVVLSTEPTVDVVIPVTSPDITEGLVSSVVTTIPSATLDLTFTSLDWQTPQVVTVNPVDELDQDGDISYNISVGAPTGASEYAALLAQTVAVVNDDDDTAIINILGADLQTTEGGSSDTFVVSLAKAPVGDVLINISSNDVTEGRIKGGNSPTTALDAIVLTFTAADWQTAQTVTVVGQDDFEIDSNQVYTIAIAVDVALTLDADYDALSAQTVSVSNADNDVAGSTVAGYAYAYESGATDFFTVKLNTMPSADVVIPLTVEDLNEFLISSGGSGFVATLDLTFTSVNWSTAQTVTVQAVDDFVDENTEYYDVTLGAATSADLNYDGLPGKLERIRITDNDIAGFVLSPSTGLATSESGTSASFTVALTTEPIASVSVTISSGNIAEGLLTGGNSPSIQVDVVTLEFLPGTWSSTQTVTVHGQNDEVLDGPIAFDLTVDTISGTDAKYNSVNIATVGVSNADDEPTAAQGTVAVPITVATTPYNGLVDTTASYYMLTGLTVDGNYDFSLSSVTDDVSLYVYSNSNFSAGLLCSSANVGTKVDELCRATTATGTVYIKVDGVLTGNGAGFVLDTRTVYSFETVSNGSADLVDTVIRLYHSSNLTSSLTSNDDGGAGTYSKITRGLVSGDTYYLRVRGFSSTSTGSYSIWVTDTTVAPSSIATPLDSDGEPGDETSAGAVALTVDVVVDRTITASDFDWFMFTVP